MVRVIDDMDAFDAVLEEAGDRLVVVDFTASWCGPCKMIAPQYAELASKPENKNVIFLKVDVDDAPDVAAKCNVNCMPTFMFFKNGEKVDDFSGANIDKLIEFVQKHRS